MRHFNALLALGGSVTFALLTALAPACSSNAASPSESGIPEPGGVDAGIAAPTALGIELFGAQCNPGMPTVAWSPLRRISRVEYDNMVRDLLGDTTMPAQSFVPESPMANGVAFENNTYGGVSTLIAQQYIQAAETLAATAVANADNLASLLPCQTQDVACATQFIQGFANRAFRGSSMLPRRPR